ncbi:DUF72 domain-containing protein [Sphingomonas psychrotolerans]|uniref:DUF72 domain-containing protein n=1 Tax=Sphingomonas psychrotolerans TaxID=1327635 RepID=A0ABU3N0I9_9SPHN|nr:DUF72 domain-containing protein [Sphingomonas psychrotolerans]MDT8758002.1 DUF72 domain-containing protein [Sphingomonas psychrotolerans]
MVVRIGTAGWSIPRQAADRVPGDGTHLQRYAQRLNVAEVNSSFHRPHWPSTYARWAESVPKDFRFAVKLPKTITHKAKLVDCGGLLAAFASEVAGLGSKRGPLLVQLPPSFAFPGDPAIRFFDSVDRLLGGQVVIEPRHASWYAPEVDRMLVERRIARVLADPPVPDAAQEPGGWRGLTYVRLHGAPRVYWSSYEPGQIAAFSDRIAGWAAAGDVWIIFDNTASGAALGNALDLDALVPRV